MPTQQQIIRATRWWQNGDHPDDDVTRGGTTESDEHWEGKVVRYYRRPDIPDYAICELCGQHAYNHGYLDYGDYGKKVCPGDWILDTADGTRYVCHLDLTPLFQTETAPLSGPANCSVRVIVARWLNENGYDGLCNPEIECGCPVHDLMPCDNPLCGHIDEDDCIAAHREMQDDGDWLMYPGKANNEVPSL